MSLSLEYSSVGKIYREWRIRTSYYSLFTVLMYYSKRVSFPAPLKTVESSWIILNGRVISSDFYFKEFYFHF